MRLRLVRTVMVSTLVPLLIDSALLAHRAYPLVNVRGADAERYLQGRLTQDIRGLALGARARSLLLSPQGQIEGQFDVIRREDNFLLVADPLAGDTSLESLTEALFRFRVADRVEGDSEIIQAVEIYGSRQRDVLRQFEGDGIAADALSCVENQRADVHFIQLLFCEEAWTALRERIESTTKALSLTWLTREEYRLLRISAAIPLAGVDLHSKVAAPDLPLEDLVSFQKGCYTGQEVVEMASARGRPNRELVVLQIDYPLSDTQLPLEISAADTSCGVLTSVAALNEQSSLGLGFLKTKRDQSQLLTVNQHAARIIPQRGMILLDFLGS